jgi:hypothetical protein
VRVRARSSLKARASVRLRVQQEPLPRAVGLLMLVPLPMAMLTVAMLTVAMLTMLLASLCSYTPTSVGSLVSESSVKRTWGVVSIAVVGVAIVSSKHSHSQL